jgi:hypothetical protein
VLRFTVSGVYSLNASSFVDSEALNVGTGNFPQLTIDCIDCSRPAPSRAEGRGLSQAPQVLSLLAFLALLVQKYKYCTPAPSRAEGRGLSQAPQVLSFLAFLALLVHKYKYCRPAPSRAESLGGLLQAPQVFY